MAGLNVCQFSRDASVAEAWLIAQEPYLASRDFGHTVDSVEKLMRRHEAFEYSTRSWEPRFAALKQPTLVSWHRCREAGRPHRVGPLDQGAVLAVVRETGQVGKHWPKNVKDRAGPYRATSQMGWA